MQLSATLDPCFRIPWYQSEVKIYKVVGIITINGWTVRRSILGRGKKFLSALQRPDRSWCPLRPHPSIQWMP